MATLSISLDNKLKNEIEKLSKEDGVSKSVVIRRLLERATWERSWKNMAAQIRSKLDTLDLTNTDTIEKYLG